ncbi:MAG: hypothetical protein R2834_03505 [Rhodothermales bacterium]
MSASPAPTLSIWTPRDDARALWLRGLVFMIVLLQLNQRPAMLQAIGEVIFLAAFGCMALFVLLRYPFTITPRKRSFILLSGLFCFYLLVQGIILQTGVSIPTINNLIFIMMSALVVLFVNAENWTVMLKAFIYPVLAFSISYAITAVLLLGLGRPLPSLAIASFTLAQVQSHYDMTIYFPFSPALGLGDVKALGFSLARATGYYREPGIYQILVSMSFFGLNYLDIRYKRMWKTLLLFSLLFTFSTAGFGAFIATAFCYYVLAGQGEGKRARWWASLAGAAALVPLVLWFVFTDKSFGLLRKLQFASGTVRVERASNAMAYLIDRPLVGGGYMNADISSINFMSVVGQIGAIGVLLFAVLVIVPNWNLLKRRDPVLVLLVPVFLTMLFSQPLFDKPLFFLTLALVAAYPRDATPSRPRWLKPAPASS